MQNNVAFIIIGILVLIIIGLSTKYFQFTTTTTTIPLTTTTTIVEPVNDISQYYNRSSDNFKIGESYYKIIDRYINEINKGNVIGEISLYVEVSENYSVLEKYGEVEQEYSLNHFFLKLIDFNNFNSLLKEDTIVYVELSGIKTFNITNELNVSELKDCEKDSDCVAISPTCCGCTGGGVETTINKKYKSMWDDYFFLKCPGPVACPAVIGVCVDDPKCVDNKCTP